MKQAIAILVGTALAVTAIGLASQPKATAQVVEKINSQARTGAVPEVFCIELAATAHSASNAIKRGASEDKVIKIAEDSGKKYALLAIRYTITIDAPPDVARSMVYSKCKAGDFGGME